MAQQTTVRLTDDIDGSEAVEAVTFGLRGVQYEIDLGAKNVAALEKALSRFVAAGRPVKPASSRRTARSGHTNGDVGEIREWARANGYSVSSRGRIPAEVRSAYEAAVR
jgi:hypothetical protein